jgi:LmbE family N-acetylglucosaminyl deacetylase
VGEERHRILVAMAHPDDVEYSCAAAIAQWVSEGCEVPYLLGTCGEAGMEDPEWTPERTACTREGEQRRAAEMVGVDSVEFLDYPDGRIMYGELLRRDLARAIRRFRPHRIVTLNYDLIIGSRHLNQADHRAFGLAVLDATRDAGARWIFPELLNEGLEPWRGVKDIYVAATAGAGARWTSRLDGHGWPDSQALRKPARTRVASDPRVAHIHLRKGYRRLTQLLRANCLAQQYIKRTLLSTALFVHTDVAGAHSRAALGRRCFGWFGGNHCSRRRFSRARRSCAPMMVFGAEAAEVFRQQALPSAFEDLGGADARIKSCSFARLPRF